MGVDGSDVNGCNYSHRKESSTARMPEVSMPLVFSDLRVVSIVQLLESGPVAGELDVNCKSKNLPKEHSNLI